eukprot:CAMPEP_0175389006 /NCGR_PEP_ID=MMETSP0095-20121207/30671_1 /TAXON_ID=311494 /ORGANISM="Alexandrium monilatum, Strain CCMP3105" /LENGTH=98 /DNA_ID=CAMNT_0016687513 /DNA_START=188 /DNA_END=484 /DNA_ORIENTATION=+
MVFSRSLGESQTGPSPDHRNSSYACMATTEPSLGEEAFSHASSAQGGAGCSWPQGHHSKDCTLCLQLPGRVDILTHRPVHMRASKVLPEHRALEEQTD